MDGSMSIDMKLFTWVLRHMHSLFSLDDFRNFMCVSKSFRAILGEYADSFVLSVLKVVFSHGEKLSRYWFKHTFYPAFKYKLTEEQRKVIRKMLNDTKNHIKNPSVSQDYEGWTKTLNGGDGWSVEKWDHKMPLIRKTQKAFCGSYSLCELTQDLDLTQIELIKTSDYHCIIETGVYASRRYDCTCKATLKISLYEDSDEPIKEIQKEVSEELPAVCPLTPYHCYRLMSIKIADKALISKAKKMKFVINTIDKKFWAGNYAARFTDMFVRVIPISYYAKVPL